MTAVRAILAYLEGLEALRHPVAARLCGSPFSIRLQYLGGHPGIWEPEAFWVGRVGDRIRLVDELGQHSYDLDASRILAVSSRPDGRLALRYEPTPGLVTSVEFQGAAGTSERCARLLSISLPA